ncbi:gamma-glutamyltransferase [Skermanella stibiiresistens SB22]|uniref:Glutathione hydrolase proenzyme n=1 Tax=Skermanella stibiiresistens SB22 TaxID=1385369 RepID=W9H0A9_9PROT|nr:gamma-glutamyltransferase [Skermanella stibiiresistens]EWY39605.1 gamma-glutamyltransferase [Skermanella stibiiresistens SB22]
MNRTRMLAAWLIVIGAAVVSPPPAWSLQLNDQLPPEIATGFRAKPLVTAEREMVVTANPEASRAGLAVLERGGNAIDAAIAVQLVLGLVEPQSSGLGGGAFLVYRDAAADRLITLDAREAAPAAATGTRFEGLTFADAVESGLSTGVPGVPRLIEDMHRRFGSLPLADLAARATELARAGFEISPRLADSIRESTRIVNDPAAKAYFFNDEGSPKTAGTLLRNEDYAQSVESLVQHGNADAFYSGVIRDDIVAAVRRDPRPGDLAAEDFTSYRIKERVPVCGPYRTYKVCGMGPPSSGGIAVAQILAMLEPFDMAAAGANTVKSVQLYTQANRLAFADRNRYVADGDFVDVPVRGLLDPKYLASRSALIGTDRDMGPAEAGEPPFKTGLFFEGIHHDLPATSHISIIDRFGNAVSMTTTVESAFGSGRMVRGFMLNNELTDFSFAAGTPDKPVANRVEPGKRPRSSMAPTIVFDKDGKVKYVLGSPGGSSIISYVAQSIVALVDWGLDPQQVAALPHFQNNNGKPPATLLEAGTSATDLAAELERMGHGVMTTDLTSGLSIIAVEDGKLLGGADIRREGLVVGR